MMDDQTSMTMASTETVPFHILSPNGSETLHLKVGADIPHSHYRKLADSKTGELYGLIVYQDGSSRTSVIPKSIWEKAQKHCQEIEHAAQEFMQNTLNQLWKIASCEDCSLDTISIK